MESLRKIAVMKGRDEHEYQFCNHKENNRSNPRRSWRYAENHFREATDQDLIDQASYDLLSAKSRYAYLLKQARSRGLSL